MRSRENKYNKRRKKESKKTGPPSPPSPRWANQVTSVQWKVTVGTYRRTGPFAPTFSAISCLVHYAPYCFRKWSIRNTDLARPKHKSTSCLYPRKPVTRAKGAGRIYIYRERVIWFLDLLCGCGWIRWVYYACSAVSHTSVNDDNDEDDSCPWMDGSSTAFDGNSPGPNPYEPSPSNKVSRPLVLSVERHTSSRSSRKYCRRDSKVRGEFNDTTNTTGASDIKWNEPTSPHFRERGRRRTSNEE